MSTRELFLYKFEAVVERSFDVIMNETGSPPELWKYNIFLTTKLF